MRVPTPYRLGPSAANEDRDDWVLVGGKILNNVHGDRDCTTDHCPIHDPSDHHMVRWPQEFCPPDEELIDPGENFTEPKAMMVRQCTHGNYHADPDSTLLIRNRVWSCQCWCCDPPKPQQKLGGT